MDGLFGVQGLACQSPVMIRCMDYERTIAMHRLRERTAGHGRNDDAKS